MEIKELIKFLEERISDFSDEDLIVLYTLTEKEIKHRIDDRKKRKRKNNFRRDCMEA